MSTQQLAEILAISAKNPPPENASPPMMRAWAEGITGHTPLADHVGIGRSSFGPYDGDLIQPEGGDASRLIIYYHGGGFFPFSSHTYRVITTNLARATASAVFAPDYRLAPEHPAPAAHDDAFGVYQRALKQGYAADRIALGGDSAGGNLALATVVRARDAGLPLPSAVVLFSPWLDFAEQGGSYRATTDDPILPPPVLDKFKSAYLGDGDRKSPAVTPLFADFTGLPPTLIHVGSWERLRDDFDHARRAAARRRRRHRVQDLRRHVPWLAALRPDAGGGHGVGRSKRALYQRPSGAKMSSLPWTQILVWAVAAFFVVAFFINTFAVKLVGPEYRRWGYPDRFHFLSGAMDLAVALLLPAAATRPFGVALGCLIMLVAVATVIRHREYHRAVPPLIVLVLLAVVGWTLT